MLKEDNKLFNQRHRNKAEEVNVRKDDILVHYVVCAALYAGFLGGVVVLGYTLGHSEQEACR
jgi:hypothetical protein